MDKETNGNLISLDIQNGNGLSYKFQRLRERLREAVTTGELAGKLPGERQLARRFRVNAKTLSKALTDLAAEGLLDRSIGRGTYVKGAAPEPDHVTGRWMIVCETGGSDSHLVRHLLSISPKSSIIPDVSSLRPSFLNQFGAVIDLAIDTPDRFLRDMQVRGMPVIVINREPGTYSVDSVSIDRSLAAANLARDLIIAGHQQIAVIESLPRSIVARAAQQAAGRSRTDVVVTTCTTESLIPAIRSGVTAVICDAAAAAQSARSKLEAAGLKIPDDISLTTIDTCDSPYPCSGQYVNCETVARAIADLLGATASTRPTTIWLAPKWIDQGTTQSLAHRAGEAA